MLSLVVRVVLLPLMLLRPRCPHAETYNDTLGQRRCLDCIALADD